MLPHSAISTPLLLLLLAGLALAGGQPVPAEPPAPAAIETGRCQQDLPLDAGQGFNDIRHLLWNDQVLQFDRPGANGPWRLRSRSTLPGPAAASGPTLASGLGRSRLKWRDGALWMASRGKLYRWDSEARSWLLRADPGLEFMDFEVDMTGRMFLVCTADPRNRSYRSLLEEVREDGRSTLPLAEYPDPGCLAWGDTVPPVAAATLQVGYEAVQITEFTVLYNPLARRVFVFRPLENRLREASLGLPRRGYPELAERPGPFDDLCWQVLPKSASEAWVLIPESGGGVRALTLDLFEAGAGLPEALPGLRLPLFPGPDGRLQPVEEALAALAKAPEPLSKAPGPAARRPGTRSRLE